MKLKHNEPCPECPWRKIAPAGWLGGHTAEFYTDAVQFNEVPACHLQDCGPDSNRTAMCAGALAVMANSCTLPHKTKGGDKARNVVGKREDCFSFPRDFYKHHTDQPYVHPMMRK